MKCSMLYLRIESMCMPKSDMGSCINISKVMIFELWSLVIEVDSAAEFSVECNFQFLHFLLAFFRRVR